VQKPGDGLHIRVDRASPVPLYFQISEQLERAIDGGGLEPGTRLDNEILLAERLDVSRPTLRRAIARLVDQGLLVRRRGLGTVVVPRRVQRPLALSSLHDDLASSGSTPATELLSAREEPASPHVASLLGVDEGSPVTALERLRSADGVRLALMHNYLPADLLPLDAADLGHHGLYALLRTRGVRPQMANQTIGARRASAREARLLDAPRGATLLTLQRTAFDSAGRAIEYGTHCYVADRYAFDMSLVAR